MDETPDYANCSLKELYDVERHIDKEKYADRYALLIHEIQKREAQRDAIPANAQTRQRSPFGLPGCLIALLGFVGGAIAGGISAGAIYYVAHPPFGPDYGEGIGWGTVFFFLVIPSGALVGGMAGAIIAVRIWAARKR
jgi:hypothetical protein